MTDKPPLNHLTIKQLRLDGLAWAQIAARYGGWTESALARAHQRWKSQDNHYDVPAKASPAEERKRLGPRSRARPEIEECINVSQRPFEIHIPKLTAPSYENGCFRALLFGDTHLPYHDPACLEVVEMFMIDKEPHRIIHMGDLNDCYELSKYDKDPNRQYSLQDEIDLAQIGRAHV